MSKNEENFNAGLTVVCDDNDRAGYVYVLSNESMPGIVKIGRSKHGGEARAKQIYQTGVPTPFKLEFEIWAEDCHEVEGAIHDQLEIDGLRLAGNREFFTCTPKIASTKIIKEIFRWLDINVVDHFIDDNDIEAKLYRLEQIGLDDVDQVEISRVIRQLPIDYLAEAIFRDRLRINRERKICPFNDKRGDAS